MEVITVKDIDEKGLNNTNKDSNDDDLGSIANNMFESEVETEDNATEELVIPTTDENGNPLTRAEFKQKKLDLEKAEEERLKELSELENKDTEDISKWKKLGIKERKKRNRKRFWIIFTVGIVLAIGSGFGTKYYLTDKHLKVENRKADLTELYKTAFTDDKERTEIVKDMPKSQYTEIKDLYLSIPDSTEKIEFSVWQKVIDEQFKNQEDSKALIAKLKEGNHSYLSDKTTQKDIESARIATRKPFNKGFQKELLSGVEILQDEFIYNEGVRASVNKLYDEKGDLVEFSKKDLSELRLDVRKIKNPEISKPLNIKLDTALTDWETRDKERKEQAKQEAEQARKEAEAEAKRQAEQAEIDRKEAEAEAKRQAIIDEAQRKSDLEAKKQSEALDAQRREADEQQRKSEAEEKARLDAEAKKYAEQQAEIEKKRVEEEIKNNAKGEELYGTDKKEVKE